MKKSEIRIQASRQRKALSKSTVHEWSVQLLEQFKTLDFSDVKSIHLFIPIEGKNEPDTFLIIAWLNVNHPHIKIIVPRADFDTALMTHHVFTGKEDLQKNLFNILEPQSTPIYSGDIDMVLIPMLAFDLRGYRVGYGKGFYDRFLQGITTRKIGLNFFGAQDQIDDIDEYDVPLDQCITPQKIYTFSSSITGQ